MTGLQVGDYSPLYLVWAGLALGAALILLAGAVSATAAPKAKAPWVIVHVGGALVIAGFAAGLSDIRDGGVTVFSGYGYGLYLTLFGGILGLTGIWGLRGSSRSHDRLRTESK
jgi:NADH:ubiquinone oxidoreductase subunit 6 (subunit J)